MYSSKNLKLIYSNETFLSKASVVYASSKGTKQRYSTLLVLTSCLESIKNHILVCPTVPTLTQS
jgi:hypothetical protein